MAGLDKIMNQILEEANHSAGEIVENARKEAEEILSEAQKEANKASEEAASRAEAQAVTYKERMRSAADLRRRTSILQAKQKTISEVLQKAYAQFCQKNDTEYFDTVKAMLEKFALAEEGEIFFSQKDLDRMPAGFEGEIRKIAEAKGGKLSLSKETRHIDGGFILAYGGIEENCSFKALFDSKRDELQDIVQKVLFV